MSAPVNISAQASAVETAEREIMTGGTGMRRSERELLSERLRAAARTLRWVERNEDTLRAAVDAAGGGDRP